MTNERDVEAKLEVEDQGAVLIARIDAGPLQVFGASLARKLEALVARADSDPEVRAVVLASRHPTRFISHADVAWLQAGGAEYAARARSGDVAPPPAPDYVGLDRLHGIFLRMNGAACVFVAALEGTALGLGAELAWACDLRVMADSDACLGQPEALLGIMPGGGGSQRLTRLVGAHRALVAILEGGPIAPAQALEMGAVDAVVPQASVVAKATALAHELAKRHKPSIGAIKRSVYFGGSLPLPQGIELEAKEFLGLVVSEEGQRRMLAYQAETAALHALPLYVEGGYDAALRRGRTLA